MGRPLDPFLVVVGGEFLAHAWTQEGALSVVQPPFPGLASAASPETVREEFTIFQSLDPAMQVLLTLDPKSMDDKKGAAYRKQSLHPVAWVRMQGKGRVFYNSLGQEPPVWDAPIFRAVMAAGLDWATGKSNHEPAPNLKSLIPDAPARPE
jgi:type 1 glutamine amidotransferase